MKTIDNILYLEFSEMIDCGVSENYLKKAKSTGTRCWHFINDPQDKRKVLIGYEELKPNYKKLIQEHFGNPYDYIAREPIKKLVNTDFKAEHFFKKYRYGCDKRLPFTDVQKYTTSASWLNMLLKLSADKKLIKKELNLSVQLFWENVGDIIKTDKINLPISYRRLTEKIKTYKEKSYSSLIDCSYGNKLAAKIGKTENGFDAELQQKQIALIRAAASKHQNFDNMQITRAVNQVFQLQDWPTVSYGTVYNIIKENSHITLPGRRGKREYNNTIGMQVMRTPPKFPLQYLTLDGWTVELLYQENGTFNNRLVVVIVLDAFNKYPVGYAIGDRENTELIRQANRNASYHIKELFGGHYQPRQLQSDRYGLKNLTPFYQSMAHLHTPAAVGNAKSKIIEPYFKSLNKNYCQPLFNWSGFNITANRNNQPNTEYLDKIKHSFPDKNAVIQQIERFMQQERKIKLQEYLAQWELMPEEEKVSLNKEDMLMVFGRSTGFTNSITGQGLMPTIEGQKIVYDSFDPKFRALQYSKFHVVYDPEDLSCILAICEDTKQKFVLDQKRALPMDVHSMAPEDYKYLKSVRDFNKDRREEIMQVYANDAAVVEEVMATTPLSLNDWDEASLKLMFTTNGQQKETLQDAKGLKKVQQHEQKLIEKEQRQEDNNWNALQQEYLREKLTDINKYLD
jgi:dihydroneopterin aldolase